MGFSERSKYIGKDMEGTVKLWEKELERGRETISPLNHRTWVRVCCSKHVLPLSFCHSKLARDKNVSSVKFRSRFYVTERHLLKNHIVNKSMQLFPNYVV